MLHSVLLLTGLAALWWEGLWLPDAIYIDLFVEKFWEAFHPHNFIESVCTKLLDIKMTSTLVEYVTRFHWLIAVLTPEGVLIMNCHRIAVLSHLITYITLANANRNKATFTTLFQLLLHELWSGIINLFIQIYMLACLLGYDLNRAFQTQAFLNFHTYAFLICIS